MALPRTNTRQDYNQLIKCLLLFISFNENQEIDLQDLKTLFEILRASRPEVFTDIATKKRPSDCIFADACQLANHYKYINIKYSSNAASVVLTERGEEHIRDFQDAILKDCSNFFFAFRRVMNLPKTTLRAVKVNMRHFPHLDDLFDEENLSDIYIFLDFFSDGPNYESISA